jgi:alanine dehydrogenase
MRQNPEIKLGANIVKGSVTYRGVADAFGLKYTSVDSLIKK